MRCVSMVITLLPLLVLTGGPQSIVSAEETSAPDALRIAPGIALVETAEEVPAGAIVSGAQVSADSIQPGSLSAPGIDSEGLFLADVIASVYRSYPEINAANSETGLRAGNLMSAYGEFDTKLYGHTLQEPTGFYENYRHGVGLARQTWWGGYVSAGYRMGRGDFQPWYKERQTHEAGEFKVAMAQPLLRGRAIDPRRLAVFNASLERQAADPLILQVVLDISRAATSAYWKWVTAGNVYKAQEELLQLAERRGEQFKSGVDAGMYAAIDLILNRQLVAERRGKILEAEQKFRAAGFKLSLYIRDGNGNPMVPTDEWLPQHFPRIQQVTPNRFEDDLADAIMRRPELQLLDLQIRQLNLQRSAARNDLLPNLDFVTELSQDIGKPATKTDDKGEFELMIGIQGEVPIQRRKARGKISATSFKLAQINEKLRLQQDKIGAELRTANNSLQLASQIVEQAEVSLRAACETLERYQFAFDRGKIDLIYLNLLETKLNETEIKLVESQGKWFMTLADLQVALGLDPLDQALVISDLPVSPRPGPGFLPESEPVDIKVLNKDWEIHSHEAEGGAPQP